MIWTSDLAIERGLALLERALLADTVVKETLREWAPMKAVFAAEDTGRRVVVQLGGGTVSCRLGGEQDFDVMFMASEETIARIMTGQEDADAAFFSGRLRVLGSLSAAFKLRVGLLGLVQEHAAKIGAPAAQ